MQQLGELARDFVIQNYELEKICLVKQMLWVCAIIGKASS